MKVIEMMNKKQFGSDGETARKFAKQVSGRLFCGKLGSMVAYMVQWQSKTEAKKAAELEIKAGEPTSTSMFLRVYIYETFENEEKMRQAGYTEMIHDANDKWKVGGKNIDEYRMDFAACRK